MNITTAELKKIILKQLKSQPQVESVDELILEQQPETIRVKGEITAMGYDIQFSGELQNSESGVVLENSEINASFLVKIFVRPYIKRVPELVKSFLEKQYKKKFKSIQITAKGLELKEKGE
jgi:hypothetical protein